MDVAWVSFLEKAGAGNLVFFRVKWLRPAMKGTSCVRRARAAALELARIGSSTVCCNEWLFMCAIRFLTLWLQIAVRWLHDCCRFVLPCASRDAGLQPDVAKRM